MGGGYSHPSEIEEGKEEMLSLPQVFGTGILVCTGETKNSPVQKEISTAYSVQGNISGCSDIDSFSLYSPPPPLN